MFYFLQLAQPHTGLSNQLFSLFSTIIHCHLNKIEYIVVDKFLTEIYSNNYEPVSNIFNLVALNKFLEPYNVFIIDSIRQNFEIQKVLYGYENETIDVTRLFQQTFAPEYNVSKEIHLLPIFLDPVPFQKKEFTIHFNPPCKQIKLKEENGYFVTNYKLDLNFMIPVTTNMFQPAPSWDLLSQHSNIANKLFENLAAFFSANLKQLNTFSFDLTQKINTIHLRIEDDGIQHWSKLQNMSPAAFKSALLSKYMFLIEEYCKKDDLTIILSYNEDNEIIDFLKENGYNYFVKNHKLKYKNREINAILDFFLGQNCNNIFIGVVGSTFSEIISKSLKQNATKIFFNINDLTATHVIL